MYCIQVNKAFLKDICSKKLLYKNILRYYRYRSITNNLSLFTALFMSSTRPNFGNNGLQNYTPSTYVLATANYALFMSSGWKSHANRFHFADAI